LDVTQRRKNYRELRNASTQGSIAIGKIGETDSKPSP